jgi:5'-nucleotidase
VQRVVGRLTATATRAQVASRENVLGNLIADAQLAATAAPAKGGAQIAFMNPGGVRADLAPAANGDVSYGQIFSVQPFGNSLVVKTMTGAQIKAVLEQQFNNPSPGQNRILQVSQGFSYTWSQSAPQGSKVSDITINGAPLDPAASYRVTVNSFLADGGDNFSVLAQGTNRLGGAVDTDALEAYFLANSPVTPAPTDRIIAVP